MSLKYYIILSHILVDKNEMRVQLYYYNLLCHNKILVIYYFIQESNKELELCLLIIIYRGSIKAVTYTT